MAQFILLSIAGLFVCWILIDDFMPGQTTSQDQQKKGGTSGIFTLLALPFLFVFLLLHGITQVLWMAMKLALPLLSLLWTLVREAFYAAGTILRNAWSLLRTLLQKSLLSLNRTLGILFRSLNAFLRTFLRTLSNVVRTFLLRPFAALLKSIGRLFRSLFRSLLTGSIRGLWNFLRLLGRSILSFLRTAVRSLFHSLSAAFHALQKFSLQFLKGIGRNMYNIVTGFLRLMKRALHVLRPFFQAITRFLTPLLESVRAALHAMYRFASFLFRSLPAPLRNFLKRTWILLVLLVASCGRLLRGKETETDEGAAKNVYTNVDRESSPTMRLLSLWLPHRTRRRLNRADDGTRQEAREKAHRRAQGETHENDDTEPAEDALQWKRMQAIGWRTRKQIISIR